MRDNRTKRRRFEDIIGGVMTDKECKTIRTTVIAGIILMLVGTIGTQLALAWNTQKKLAIAQEKLFSEFADIKKVRQTDALRTQMNMHDMATVIDVVRDVIMLHTFPGMKNKPYTPLAERIPDVPSEVKDRLNHHIGDVPLVTGD